MSRPKAFNGADEPASSHDDGASPYSARRLIAILLATAGMATQWAALHGVTFFGTIFENSAAAKIDGIWVVNTLTTFTVFLACLLASRRIGSLLSRRPSLPIVGFLILIGQATLLASTIANVPSPMLYLGDILLACGTTPLIIVWGEMYRFLDPHGEQLFVTLVSAVASVVLYLLEVLLPDPFAMVLYVALPLASLACLRSAHRTLIYLSDRRAPQQNPRPQRSAALFYVCIAIFSMPYNYLMSSEVTQTAMGNRTTWETVLAIVVIIMVGVALAEVAAERKGFLLSPVSVLVLLSAALLTHVLAPDFSSLLVPSLLFSGYYLFLAMVYLALGPIVATQSHHPMRVFSIAMVANVGGLLLGTAMAKLANIVSSSVASLLVMALTYAILLFGFALLSSRSQGIFRVNYYNRDEYSFEYIGPIAPVRISPAQQKAQVRQGAESSGQESTDVPYFNALANNCDTVAAIYQLSKRERQVLLELARGKTIATIAGDLIVSENTVKAHTKSIYRKLGIHTREELLAAIESV